jgi:hypothetical protein
MAHPAGPERSIWLDVSAHIDKLYCETRLALRDRPDDEAFWQEFGCPQADVLKS